MPSTIEALFILVEVLVPGYIADTILSGVRRSFAQKERQANEWLVSVLFLSMLLYLSFGTLIFAWLHVPFPTLTEIQSFTKSFDFGTLLWWIVFFVAAPALLGIMLLWLASRVTLYGVYDILGIPYLSPVPRAWDYYFGKKEWAWLIITLTDGSKVGGFLGPDSFTSSYPASDDIFLEQIYRITEEGLADEPEPNLSGLWVSGSQIRSIEFLPYRENGG